MLKLVKSGDKKKCCLNTLQTKSSSDNEKYSHLSIFFISECSCYDENEICLHKIWLKIVKVIFSRNY